MKYGRDNVSVDTNVDINTLRSKDPEFKCEQKNFGSGESLYFKGKNSFKKGKSFKGKKHKERNTLKCFICPKEGHFKRDCPEKRKLYNRDHNRERGHHHYNIIKTNNNNDTKYLRIIVEEMFNRGRYVILVSSIPFVC